MESRMAAVEANAGSNACEKSEIPILVFGDGMLDSFVDGEVSRISPEAPVPVLCNPTDDVFSIGGAGNVAHNLCTLGNEARLVAGVGANTKGEFDSPGLELIAQMKAAGLSTEYLAALDRMTTVKRRMLAGKQQLLRIDREDCSPLAPQEEERVLYSLNKALDGVGAIIISDYAKGMLTEKISAHIADYAKENDVLLLADVKLANLNKLSHLSLLKPNLKEAQEFTGINFTGDMADVATMADVLSSRFSCKVVITCGGRGMILHDGNETLHLTAPTQEVFDVSGAGDTVMAALAHGLIRNLSLEESASLASIAAGIAVSKRGVVAVSIDEVKNGLGKKIVPKTWGHEEWIVNSDYCGKKLVLNKGYCCSLHYHKVKDETFYIASGRVGFQMNDEHFILNPGDSLLIVPGTKHRFYGLEDSQIFEFSTHHMEEDSYRDEVSGTFEASLFENVQNYKAG